MSKYLIELPNDPFGNRSVTNSRPCVIEVEEQPDGGFDIVAPDELRGLGVHRFYTEYWIECEGPARHVTEGEREAIIEAARRDTGQSRSGVSSHE